MKWMDDLIDKWYRMIDKISPFFEGVARVFRAIGRTFRNFWKYMFWFRSLVLGAPMAGAAIILAAQNMNRLPDMVTYTKLTVDAEAANALFGFLVMSQDSVSKNLAVIIPVGLTAACIVLMIFSKRMFYPFVIGLMTLLLPQIIYWFTIYPM